MKNRVLSYPARPLQHFLLMSYSLLSVSAMGDDGFVKRPVTLMLVKLLALMS